jgi:hypothetical protein
MKLITRFFASLLLGAAVTTSRSAEPTWVTYEPKAGPGAGKHIVLMSGDEEYRSEEGLPQLGKILSQRHGFKCTVLFAVDPATGEIAPNKGNNIPGTEALNSADLLIILTRFRNLPDEQMKPVDAFLKAGKPVIGLRTATHAFNGMKGDFARYNNGYKGEPKEWADGFGRLVLGEQWISHHGSHKGESTRGLFAPDAQGNPLLNGIKDGEIWGATDVYGVRLPLPGDSKPLVLGQVVKRKGPAEKDDKNFGLRPTDNEPVEGKKNDPMMPIVWTKSYQLPEGKPGKAFTTTMGSSTDLENEALRRLLVNATYQLLGMPVPAKAEVDIVGEYKPTAYGFGGFKKGVKPADHKL